jgi:hypothetical protein
MELSMKKHANTQGSRGNGQKRREQKKAERERAYRKAHNVLVRNRPSYRQKRAREDHPWRTWITRRGAVRKGEV